MVFHPNIRPRHRKKRKTKHWPLPSKSSDTQVRISTFLRKHVLSETPRFSTIQHEAAITYVRDELNQADDDDQDRISALKHVLYEIVTDNISPLVKAGYCVDETTLTETAHHMLECISTGEDPHAQTEPEPQADADE
jgi:hypothetical protein